MSFIAPKTRRNLAIALFVVAASAPALAAATIWDTPNTLSCVSGGGPTGPCTFCDGLKLIANVINFLFTICIPLAVLVIVYGGILLMFAGGSEKNVEKGKSAITSALIGVFIALFSWVIVGTFLQIISGGANISKWWPPTNISC